MVKKKSCHYFRDVWISLILIPYCVFFRMLMHTQNIIKRGGWERGMYGEGP